MYKISLKKACKIFSLSRSNCYNKVKNKNDTEIKTVLLKLAEEHIRWGFGKMRRAIKRQGYSWNHKRIRRVYCELGLNLCKKPKKRLPTREKKSLLQPLAANYCWSMDFMSDALEYGKKFRTFNVIDDFNREALGIKVGCCLPSLVIINYLDDIARFRGYPAFIRVDNGPEFISNEFVNWAKRHQIIINYIQPGKPAQNGYIERFNRMYREDVLDIYLFGSIDEAQEITDKWLDDYNQERPHESLKNLSPIEFLRAREGMPSLAQIGAVTQ